MNQNQLLKRVKQWGTALAFILYPLLAGFAFAVHPDLLSLSVEHSITSRIAEFHGNQILHFGHFLMLLAVPMLIIIALHFIDLLQTKSSWWGFIGGVLAIGGALILAVDKSALCLVPSAFDTLSEADFSQLTPAIETMFHYRGWLWVLQLLPILPLGFILQSIGLVRTGVISRRYSIPMLAGSVLMFNPDIDIIGLVATVLLGIGFIPYALRLLQKRLDADIV